MISPYNDVRPYRWAARKRKRLLYFKFFIGLCIPILILALLLNLSEETWFRISQIF